MSNNGFLQNRAMGIFGMFMILVYAGLGIGMLFFWKEVANHTIIGAVLLLWASFRVYMLVRHRRQAK